MSIAVAASATTGGGVLSPPFSIATFPKHHNDNHNRSICQNNNYSSIKQNHLRISLSKFSISAFSKHHNHNRSICQDNNYSSLKQNHLRISPSKISISDLPKLNLNPNHLRIYPSKFDDEIAESDTRTKIVVSMMNRFKSIMYQGFNQLIEFADLFFFSLTLPEIKEKVVQAINARIQTHGCLRAVIKSVDAQHFYNEGVNVSVIVIGYMIHADESRRMFVQSIILAQEKGCFVWDDVFRYLDDVFRTASSLEEAPPVQENHVAEESNREVYYPHENGEIPAEEHQVQEEEEEEEPVSTVVDDAPNDSQASNARVENVPKKSYASIVMKATSVVTAPSPNHPKSVPKVQEQHMPAASAPLSR